MRRRLPLTLLLIALTGALMFGGVALVDHVAKTNWSTSDSRWRLGRTRSQMNPDTFFIASLDGLGVPYSSDREAIDAAREVCAGYGDGTFRPTEFRSSHPEWSTAAADDFAAAATTAYCPKYAPSAERTGT